MNVFELGRQHTFVCRTDGVLRYPKVNSVFEHDGKRLIVLSTHLHHKVVNGCAQVTILAAEMQESQ